jgi:hypothetical protein
MARLEPGRDCQLGQPHLPRLSACRA